MTLTHDLLRDKLESTPWPDDRNEAWRRTRPSDFDLKKLDSLRDSRSEGQPGDRQKGDSSSDGGGGCMNEAEARRINLEVRGASWHLDAPDGIRTETDSRGDDGLWAFLSALPEGSLEERDLLLSALHPGGYLGLALSGDRMWSTQLSSGSHELEGEGDAFSPVLFLRAEKGSRIDWHIRLEGSGFFHPVFLIHAGEEASVNVFYHQDSSDESRLLGRQIALLDRGACMNLLEVHTGGRLVKSSADIYLQGEGAEARLEGLSLNPSGRQQDLGVLQDHRAPHTFSRSHYRSITARGGYSIFQGLINVDERAHGTNAYLDNKNLITEPGGRADSLPRLNIDQNDVKCSHGSTTGRLREDQIFYLMSRGFSRSEAKGLLLRSFSSPVLERADSAVLDRVEELLVRSFPEGAI